MRSIHIHEADEASDKPGSVYARVHMNDDESHTVELPEELADAARQIEAYVLDAYDTSDDPVVHAQRQLAEAKRQRDTKRAAAAAKGGKPNG